MSHAQFHNRVNLIYSSYPFSYKVYMASLIIGISILFATKPG